MRVAVGRSTVRRPAGVTDTGRTVGERAILEVIDEHLELSGALAGADVALGVDHGDARGVVSAVLESSESAQKDLDALVVSDVAHDSTHGVDLRRPIWLTPRR